MIKKAKSIFSNFKSIMKMGEMKILPGQLAYSFILSIIPLLAIIVASLSKIIDTFNIESALNGIFPEFVARVLIPIITSGNMDTHFVVTLLLAFFFASNGPYSIINTADMLYGVKDVKPLRDRIKAFIMTFFLFLVIVFLILIPIFGDLIVKTLSKIITTGTTVTTIYNILKLPISFLLIYLNIKILYTIAPNKSIKSKETTIGAIFTTIGWILATEIYSLYITKIANYSIIYGNIANVIVLFIWIYFLSYIFVAGIALNNNHYKKTIEK